MLVYFDSFTYIQFLHAAGANMVCGIGRQGHPLLAGQPLADHELIFQRSLSQSYSVSYFDSASDMTCVHHQMPWKDLKRIAAKCYQSTTGYVYVYELTWFSVFHFCVSSRCRIHLLISLCHLLGLTTTLRPWWSRW